MNFIFIIGFAITAFGAEIPLPAKMEVKVLQDTREGPIGAKFNNILELDNGVMVQESGLEGSDGQIIVQGKFSFVSPEGKRIEVNYTADENGFQPKSQAIPKDYPLPAHAQEQIKIAQEQDAQGIKFDEKGFRV